MRITRKAVQDFKEYVKRFHSTDRRSDSMAFATDAELDAAVDLYISYRRSGCYKDSMPFDGDTCDREQVIQLFNNRMMHPEKARYYEMLMLRVLDCVCESVREGFASGELNSNDCPMEFLVQWWQEEDFDYEFFSCPMDGPGMMRVLHELDGAEVVMLVEDVLYSGAYEECWAECSQ